jgi:hypothetical protein
MKNILTRMRRLEEIIHEEKGLTAEDAALVLSVLPPEYAAAIRAKIIQRYREKQGDQAALNREKSNSQSGLLGETLKSILNNLPAESASALRAKIIARGMQTSNR